MSEKEQPHPVRDQWTPPPLDMENMNASIRWWEHTHFFLEWAKDEEWIYPCFGIEPPIEQTFEIAKQHKDFHKLEIFGFDVENRDERRFQKLIWMEKAFLHFFKEVFEIRAIEEGYHYSFDLSRIGLPKQTYDKVMQVITEHGLSEFWELIFFIIAKAQDFYNDKVRFLETKEEREKLRNIDKEVNKAIQLVEKVIRDPFEPYDKRSDDKLLRINFVFQNSPAIQIKDPSLTWEFVKHFKEHYANCYYKDWKLQLQYTPFYYEEDRLREQFKFRYAIALYNFFTETGLIKLKGKPFPNNLIECITSILEFSLVRVGKAEQDKSEKIKVVRNWIKDHTLKPATTFEKIEPDLNKLYRYFDKEFINSAGEIKRADAIKDGLTLCIKYKIQNLQNEIIHIVACLKEWHWRVSQQLERGPLIENNPLPKEYEALKLLMLGGLKNKNFSKITFHVEGDEEPLVLTDKLPLYLIQSALKSHYEEFKEDYEFDILQAEIKNGFEHGSFSAKTTGKFNLPEERFLPKFINSFFNFLNVEAPALDREYKPADRYYFLIAKALHLTGYFLSQFPEDWELKSKVEYWHSLIAKQENNSKKTPH